jgi:hypothetical protein
MTVFSVLDVGDAVSLSTGDRIEQGKDQKMITKVLIEPVGASNMQTKNSKKRRENRSALRLWLNH